MEQQQQLFDPGPPVHHPPRVEETSFHSRDENRWFNLSASQFHDPRSGSDYDLVMQVHPPQRKRDKGQAFYRANAYDHANPNQRSVGYLEWYGAKPEDRRSGDSMDGGYITGVFTDPDHRRRGVASALHELAMRAPDQPVHDTALSRRGAAWARSVGGPTQGKEHRMEIPDEVTGDSDDWWQDDMNYEAPAPAEAWWDRSVSPSTPLSPSPRYEQLRMPTGGPGPVPAPARPLVFPDGPRVSVERGSSDSLTDILDREEAARRL